MIVQRCLVALAALPAMVSAGPGAHAQAAAVVGGVAGSQQVLGVAAHGADRERALDCMALAIAYEAGREPLAGRQAVAEVILNRTRHPAYPKSVCGVVFQGSHRRTGCQFTFTCDGALRRAMPAAMLESARAIARRVLDGESDAKVGGATHYHANYVSPYWAPSLIRLGQIGAHIFYRAPGSADGLARYVPTAEPALADLGRWATAIDPITQGRRRQPALPPSQPETLPASSDQPAARTFAPWGLRLP